MLFVLTPLMLLALYAVVIRPQQQRVRAQQAVIASLEVGDEVMSSAGILGRITALDDEIATLEVAPGTELRIARGAIARRLTPCTPSPEDVPPANGEPAEPTDTAAETRERYRS